jgi:hypothetical protein
MQYKLTLQLVGDAYCISPSLLRRFWGKRRPQYGGSAFELMLGNIPDPDLVSHAESEVLLADQRVMLMLQTFRVAAEWVLSVRESLWYQAMRNS